MYILFYLMHCLEHRANVKTHLLHRSEFELGHCLIETTIGRKQLIQLFDQLDEGILHEGNEFSWVVMEMHRNRYSRVIVLCYVSI